MGVAPANDKNNEPGEDEPDDVVLPLGRQSTEGLFEDLGTRIMISVPHRNLSMLPGAN